MIIHDGEVLRNLQEQVEKNKDDILYILEERGVLNQFGIRVMAVVKTVADIPTVDKYKEDNPEWSYGDCYMVGESEPYIMYILTRANGTILNDYWLNIGQFPLAGPKGDKGDNGIGIDTMQVINFPSGAHSVTYDTTDGTMVHGTMDLTYMDGDSAVTENVGNVTVDIPITYGDGLKADATATNDKVEVKVDGSKVMKMPELDQQNLYLGVAVGKWFSGTSSTKVPDDIQWRDVQKNVKNNAMVQRTENGNVLLPEGFPADVGGGVDQYGNVIDNMAVPKSYVDSHAGGSIAWYTEANAPAGKNVLFQIIRTKQISVTLSNGETTTLILIIMAPGKINTEGFLRIFVSAWIRDEHYKYYATSGLCTNLGSGYKVFVNIYSVETGDKVGTYTGLISTLYSDSNYKYLLM